MPRLPDDAYDKVLPIWRDQTLTRREKERAAYKALWGFNGPGQEVAFRLAFLGGAAGIVIGAFEGVKALVG